MAQNEVDATVARSEELDKKWKELEDRMGEFEQEREAFEREFGFSFEQYVEYCSTQTKQAESTMDSAGLAKLQEQREQIMNEFETEVAQAKASHDAQKQLGKSSGSARARRMRNRV